MKSDGNATDIGWFPTNYTVNEVPKATIFTFLFKIVSPCNLNCDYCYVYQGPDQSWRSKPKFMPVEVLEAACRRISEHVVDHSLERVAITFHGGEPLLAGFDRLKTYIETIKSLVPCEVELATQTNATLLSPEILDLFAEHTVRIGMSIDGPEEINDNHRRFRNGRSSFKRTIDGVKLTNSKESWKALLGGYLTVIDLEHDPREVFHFMAELGSRGFDVLLPDCNHEAPPARPEGDVDKTAYGVWMGKVYDEWLVAGRDIEIRYFDEITAMIFGLDSSTEAIGAKIVDLIVVESNGDIEAVDTLKMVSREATKLGLSVFENSFDEVLLHPAVHCRLVGYDALCDTCHACDYLSICAGGYIPHRYSRENGFQNPSVYCNDIKYLISHIRSRVKENIIVEAAG